MLVQVNNSARRYSRRPMCLISAFRLQHGWEDAGVYTIKNISREAERVRDRVRKRGREGAESWSCHHRIHVHFQSCCMLRARPRSAPFFTRVAPVPFLCFAAPSFFTAADAPFALLASGLPLCGRLRGAAPASCSASAGGSLRDGFGAFFPASVPASLLPAFSAARCRLPSFLPLRLRLSAPNGPRRKHNLVLNPGHAPS